MRKTYNIDETTLCLDLNRITGITTTSGGTLTIFLDNLDRIVVDMIDMGDDDRGDEILELERDWKEAGESPRYRIDGKSLAESIKEQVMGGSGTW